MPETEKTEGYSGQPTVSKSDGDESGGRKVDLEALAERIYRLLKEEARVERERLARS